MNGRTPSLMAAVLSAGLMAFASLAPGPAWACGWWGDGEMNEEEDAIVIGADGKPVVVPAGSGAPARQAAPALAPDHPYSQFRNGNRYRAGKGVAEDPAEAARWYRRSAEQGFVGAQNNLAAMLEEGLGVAKNETEAARWYKAAAEQGDEHAQHSLAHMYWDGRGVHKDLEQAAQWMRRAADQGHDATFIDMGDMYWRGIGVDRDPVSAAMWWSLAADRGDRTAARSLRRARAAMTPDQVREANEMAREWIPIKALKPRAATF
jgi:TPR repeat protein